MGLSFLSKFEFYAIAFIATTVSSKNEVMISACKFLVNLPYGVAWITVAISAPSCYLDMLDKPKMSKLYFTMNQ